MFTLLLNSSAGVRPFLKWIEYASIAIEFVAVAIISIVVLVSTLRYITTMLRSHGTSDERYTAYRRSLAKVLLLGLEILVAADIVRTTVQQGLKQLTVKEICQYSYVRKIIQEYSG